MNRMNTKGQAGIFIAVGVIVIFVIALIISVAGFDTVNASHKGVKVKFGQIQGTMEPGLAWTGLFVDVHQYNLRMRKMHVDMDADQSAVDKDGQSVFADIEINYVLNPTKIENIYSQVGSDNGRLETTLNIEGIVKEGFKAVTSKYSSLEIIQNRGQVKEEAIEQITANFPAEYFTLSNVIVSNLDFNAEWKKAIEQKKTNEELAKAEEKNVEREKQKADQAIEIARGQAESKKLAAEAEAYQRLTMAKAEAESLRLKKAELTPQMIQNNWIDAWNGQLPTYVLTSEENSNMLLQLPGGMK